MPGEVYQNVVRELSQPPWSWLFYVVANVALGFHLYHGLWSLFQSLGWNHPRCNALARRASPPPSPGSSPLGNVSFPLAVLAGRG